MFTPGIPLYRQVRERIQDLISSKRRELDVSLKDFDLADRFGVSRITVRRAVDELVDAGMLYRIPGVGTFARPPKLREKLTLQSFLDPWSHSSGRLRIRVGEMRSIKANRELSMQLQVPTEEELIFVQRLRFHGDALVIIDERFMRAKHARQLTEQDIVSLSFVEYFRKRENIMIDRGDMDIEARGAKPREATLFGVKRNHPVLVRRVKLYAHRRKPVMSGLSIYRADRVSYRITLTP
jgi:GntR family transcriptional regulator